MIELVQVERNNLDKYLEFEQKYDGSLKTYMGRVYPDHHELFEERTSSGLLYWRYIVSDGLYVGSVWLERETADLPAAVMGVFIIDDAQRGKRIGEQAIGIAVLQGPGVLGVDRVDLNVRTYNERAIRCYRKCGFQIVSGFTKPDGTEVYRMTYFPTNRAGSGN